MSDPDLEFEERPESVCLTAENSFKCAKYVTLPFPCIQRGDIRGKSRVVRRARFWPKPDCCDRHFTIEATDLWGQKDILKVEVPDRPPTLRLPGGEHRV